VLGCGILWAWGSDANVSSTRSQSIAVVSFSTRGDDIEPWNGIGLAREVGYALTRSGSIIVQYDEANRTDRTSGGGGTISELVETGRRLHTDFVLAGTVARTGNRSEIGVRVVRVRDTREVWNGTFWRNASEQQSLPDDLAAAVVGALPALRAGDSWQRERRQR
jgi:TolB-like protein